MSSSTWIDLILTCQQYHSFVARVDSTALGLGRRTSRAQEVKKWTLKFWDLFLNSCASYLTTVTAKIKPIIFIVGSFTLRGTLALVANLVIKPLNGKFYSLSTWALWIISAICLGNSIDIMWLVHTWVHIWVHTWNKLSLGEDQSDN